MAVPARKTSKARTRGRKSINMKLTPVTLINCSQCGNKVQRHTACPKCGYYKGNQILDIAEA